MFEFNELTWNNITIEVKTKRKNLRILDNVSGKAKAGRMHIIMGPSGSGKSTLINTLMGHVPFEFKTNGEILVDNKERNNEYQSKVGLCDQQDAYFDYYTAFEFLKFHSLGKNRLLNENESEEKINFLLERLALDGKRDTLVSKLSGGERKRLVLISELMTKKKIIFLDEPTSGLDSHLALSLIVFLKEITIKDNLLMFVTIHQPSPTIVNMFDDFTFIAWGRVMYHGEYTKCEKYFGDYGFNKPNHITFTEYLFELTCEKSCFDEIVPNLDKVKSLLPPTDSSPVNSNKSNYFFNTKFSFKVIFALFKRMITEYVKGINLITIIATFISFIYIGFILYKCSKKIKFYKDNASTLTAVTTILTVKIGFFGFITYFATQIHQLSINFWLSANELLKSEIKNSSYTITELLVTIIFLCFTQSFCIFLPIIGLLGIINLKLVYLAFLLLLPFILIFTLISVLLSFVIPFVASLLSMLIHISPLLIYGYMESRKIQPGSNEFGLNFLEASLIYLNIFFNFFPQLLYSAVINDLYFKKVVEWFELKQISDETLKELSGIRNYFRTICATNNDMYFKKWKLFLIGISLVGIICLMAFYMIFKLKNTLLIPYRYKLMKK